MVTLERCRVPIGDIGLLDTLVNSMPEPARWRAVRWLGKIRAEDIIDV
jgi:hypothetical protein